MDDDHGEAAQEEASNEFEKEMDQVLESKFQEAETSCGISKSSVSPAGLGHVASGSGPWDQDSDDEDEWESDKPAKPHEKVNDDLFYDPNMDDEDQKWVENIRKDYNKGRRRQAGQGQKEKPLPNSDAVLNCPACFMVLCLDCQRHETYEHQYRAMFVMNCSVDQTQQLKHPMKSSKKGKGKKPDHSSADPNDIFNPVNCDRCSTQVAVYDREEIYHFFNVLASY